jgi:uncharacterized protein YndB with AHSA1/START domain
MARSTFVYVTYIRTTPEKLWAALTEQEFITQYWFGTQVLSAWQAGSSWQMTWPDGTVADTGEILESDPPRKLVIRWHHQKKPELHAEGASLCTIVLEPTSSAVKLSLTHSIEAHPSKFIEAVSGGWPKILSNLKSLLETGTLALDEAYPKSDSADKKLSEESRRA